MERRSVRLIGKWSQEEVYDKLINVYGISKGKSNLATGSFSFVNEMDINDLERENEFSTKGT